MSEYIKTGREIHREIQEEIEDLKKDTITSTTFLLDMADEQWVSLSWLKEQIDKQTNAIADNPISFYDTGAWDMLRWFSKLLEDEVKQK